MTYISYDKRELEEFLRANTTYDVDLIFRTKSLKQIAGMCKNIQSAMRKYPKEISDFLDSNPEAEPYYSAEDLYSMTYNELVSVRKKLGIKNTRKKVVKQEDASEANQLGIDFVRSEQTNQLCIAIMSSGDDERDLQILTEEEIREMYDGEELSKEDLAKRGIVSDSTNLRETEEPEDERFSMIDEILSSNISIANQEININFLYTLSEAELKTLHNIAKSFIQYSEKERSLKK